MNKTAKCNYQIKGAFGQEDKMGRKEITSSIIF